MAEVSQTHAPSFPPVTFEDWRAKVEADLGGAPFEKRLVAQTREGLEIQPLYSDRPDADAVLARGAARWERHEELDGGDVARRLARLDAARRFGVDGVRLTANSPGDFTRLAQRARELDLALHLSQPEYAAEMLGSGVNGGAGLAPDAVDSELLLAWRECTGDTSLVTVRAAAAERRGAGEALQIALLLAGGACWLRRAEELGLSVPEADAALEFELGLGTDLFLEMAKLRATRLAWSRLFAACEGAADAPRARLHARSSERAWTVRDPWVNALRATTMTFAGALGGADSITALPFDALLGVPDDEALRLAANTHAILADESHLAAVDDPAAGSGYVEELTDALAREAWARFRRIEELGGLSSKAARAWIDERIAEVDARDACEVASRKRGIVGVSEYPFLDEEQPARAPRERPAEPRTLAGPYEALRSRSDAHLAATGARPTAFLACLGAQAEFRARAGFARNLLAAGGIAAAESDGFEVAATAAEAFRAGSARIAVICGTDARYVQDAAPLAEALAAAGAVVVLAGKPGEHEDTWRAAGVSHFVHLGCDALGVLRQLLDAAEVSA